MVALEREFKFPLLADDARSEALAESVSYTRVPQAFRPLNSPFTVTAIDAAGKARCVMAS